MIDQAHYKEIMEVIENFENYHVEKERLINTRSNIENVSQWDVQEIIEQSRHNREKINTFVERMLKEMRGQVSGKRNISSRLLQRSAINASLLNSSVTC